MKLLCFGDSNTYGFDPRDPLGGRYDACHRWPDILARNTGWEVVNEGVNGRQIPRNPYVLRLLQAQAPVDIFLVMLGTNDLLQGASAEETALRMEHFLQPLLTCPCRTVLVAPPPLCRGAWVLNEELVNESRRLVGELAALARKLRISFVDTSGWNIPTAFDGVHLSEAGHLSFAELLLSHIP